LDIIKEKTNSFTAFPEMEEAITSYAIDKNLLIKDSSKKIVLEAVRFEAV